MKSRLFRLKAAIAVIGVLSAQSVIQAEEPAADDPSEHIVEVELVKDSSDKSSQSQNTVTKEVIVLQNGDEKTSDKAARELTLEEDVLIVGDGEEQVKRVLRFDAVPAGDVLAVTVDSELESEQAGKHWIGVQITEVTPALRAQLNLEPNRGVLIGQVLPDSPASKGDVKQYDILLAIGDKKVASNEDVLKAIKDVDGKEVKLMLLRGGSERTVSVQPAERPKQVAGVRTREFADWVQRLEPKDVSGAFQVSPDQPQFNVIRPGAALVLSDSLDVRLPDDVSITITRKGKAPAKIKIQQKERQIDATEDDLSQVPEDLRAYVDAMLARPGRALNLRKRVQALAEGETGPARARLRLDMRPDAQGDVLIPAPATKELRVRRLPPGGPAGDVSKRVEALERRLDELTRSIGKQEEEHEETK